MGKVMIEFLDPDPVSTLVPVHTINPDLVYLLVDKRRQSKKYNLNMIHSLQTWKRSLQIEIAFVDIFEPGEIRKTINSIIAAESDQKVYVDIYGGNELMTAEGLAAAFENEGVIPVYLNSKKKCIYDIRTSEKILDTVMISLDDYMLSIGSNRVKKRDDEPSDSMKEQIVTMSEYLIRHDVEWNVLSTYMNQHHDESLIVEVPPVVTANGKTIETEELLREFIRNGFLFYEGRGLYCFLNMEVKRWMMKFGTWLEMFIYYKAREAFGNAYTSVEIDWDNGDSDFAPDNEVDVITMKDSVPVFISCKMCPVTRDFVYEISAIARRGGGVNSAAIIATTDRIDPADPQKEAIWKRLRSMKVGLIRAEELVEAAKEGKSSADFFSTLIEGIV